MRRKTKIVFGITLMVFVLVVTFSYIYISQLLRQQVTSAYDIASFLSEQLAYATDNAQPDLASTRVDTNNPAAVRAAIADYLATDANLNTLLESVVGTWTIIYDAAIAVNNKALLHTNSDLIGKPLPARPDFALVRDSNFWKQLKIVYSPAAVYEVRMPLKLSGTPFGTVRVGVSTVFLKNQVTPHLKHAIVFSSIALLISIILAAGLSNLALGPLEQIRRSLESMGVDDKDLASPSEDDSGDEYGLVTLKIAHLGRQMRDAREIFSALKDNVDQIMANLQDGLMLFTRDSRVVLVSASVESFLGRPRGEMLGRTVDEIFSPSVPVEALLLKAFDRKWPIAQHEVEASGGRRIQISLDFIQERGTQIGALLTLHDMESVHKIENEIETSRRLSANSRLTRGVAHEVKNPINAIVLHLQLLQNKLDKVNPDARRHIDIIGSEIHRLDRVVQILVDFTRQRELHFEELDLRSLIDEVALLATPDAEAHAVTLIRELPGGPLPVKVDIDFIKQALLNVVINGEQAMPDGGTLFITARRDEGNAVIEIRDEGGGIPREVQEKIFELYFTTKKDGSGIGLAQTYQIMQWHYGSIDFETIEGKGTTFRLRLPLSEARLTAQNEKEVTA